MEIIFILIAGLFYYLLNQKIKKLQSEVDSLRTKVTKLERKPHQEQIDEKVSEVIQEIKPNVSFKVESTPFIKTESTKIETENISEDHFVDKAIAFAKENFLTIIGIVTLVLGIGYFVKYAIDQDWINETFRVIIGLIVGLLIIGTGHYLRKQFDVFSSIIVGGGIAVLYFTITLAFREYHLLSQQFAFGILACITILSIILSLLYNQQVLTIFSILGGFGAPLMVSTNQNNYEFLFSYIFILNCGTLLINWKKNWKNIGYLSFVLTLFFLVQWLFSASLTKSILLFIFLFTIQFILFSLVDVIKKSTIKTSDIVLYVTSSMLFCIIGIYSYQTFYASFTSLVPFLFACINFGLYVLLRKRLTISGVTLSLGIAFITLVTAIEFDAHLITIIWAVQSSLLLYLWNKMKDIIFKASFIALFPFFIISLCITWAKYLFEDIVYPPILNTIFITSYIVFICSIINISLIKKFDDKEKFLGIEIVNARNLFSLTSVLFIYFGLLFELIYQTQKTLDWNAVYGLSVLYTIYFLSVILLFSPKFNLNTTTKYCIGIINFIFMMMYPLVVMISDEILYHQKPIMYYPIYILYLIPFAFFTYKFLTHEEFDNLKQSKFSQWFVFIVGVFVICFEVYNFYMLALIDKNQPEHLNHHQDVFRLIILPIIWAILGFITIYYGFRKNIKNLPIMGFVLFGLIVLKLYLIDVWEMSNEFRIISFIVLGILILITSFMYQKLKKMMTDLFLKND